MLGTLSTDTNVSIQQVELVNTVLQRCFLLSGNTIKPVFHNAIKKINLNNLWLYCKLGLISVQCVLNKETLGSEKKDFKYLKIIQLNYIFNHFPELIFSVYSSACPTSLLRHFC